MLRAREIIKQLSTGPGFIPTLSNFIIRPPRSEYELSDLGPEVFRIGEDCAERFRRVDFELENMRGMTIQCSWFKAYKQRCQPCVVYCHANCGSRRDGLETLFLLRYGFSVFTFDFCGCGMSDGEYISLGFYERQDLAAVVEYLSSQSSQVDGIALWGRSMGAVTAIMYASKDPSIQCIICDSPFASLRRLIADLVAQHGGRAAQYLPNLVINTIVERIRKNIVTLAAFDIDDLDTIKYAAECAVPALIIHGKEDDFVLPQQSLSVADTFFAPCIHELVSGTHNDERDSRTEELIAAFLHLYLIDKRHPANCVSEKNTTTVQKETRPREAVERSETEQNAEHEPCNSVCTTTSESSMSKEEQQPSPIVTEVKALESVGKKNEVNIQKSEKALTSNTEPSQLQSPPPTSSTHNFSVDNTTTLLCAKPEPLHLHPLNLVSVEDNDNVEFAECTNKKIAEEQKEQQEEEEEWSCISKKEEECKEEFKMEHLILEKKLSKQ